MPVFDVSSNSIRESTIPWFPHQVCSECQISLEGIPAKADDSGNQLLGSERGGELVERLRVVVDQGVHGLKKFQHCDVAGDGMLRVHHFSYDPSTCTLRPSWVEPKKLAAYLEDPETNRAPKERLQEHVPYVDSISVADVLLSGAAAELRLGDQYPSQEQHDSLRYFLRGRAGVNAGRKCFKTCPLC